MTKAMVPGSFDPITLGHLDIISRASRMFDEVNVVILHNEAKKSMFSIEEKVEMISHEVQHLKNVKVDYSNTLAVDYAKKHDISVMVRGVRSIMDYAYEVNTASANTYLNSDIETILLISKSEYEFVSSSAVKEIALYKDDLTGLVSEYVSERIKDKKK